MKNLIKNKKIIYIFSYIVFSIIVGILYLYNLKMNNKELFINYQDKIYIIYIIVFGIISSLIGSLILFLDKFKDIQFHKKFFIIGLILGILYMGLSPFYTGSDEREHFFRIYEISSGNIITPMDENNSQGSIMPSSLDDLFMYKLRSLKYTDLKEAISIPLNKDETKYYENYYPSSSIYPPLQYLPQIVGVTIGRLLNFNVYFIGMLGRLFGFIFWLLICTYAIKIIPTRKMFMSLILLNPISISFAATITGDMMTNSMIILFISNIFNICYNKREINKKDIIILTITSIMISVCKIVYLPVILILFIIPKDSFKNVKKYYSTLSIIIIISVVCSYIWLNITDELLSGYYTNSELQKTFLLTNPIQYILICMKTILKYFDNFIMSITAGPIMFHGNVSIYPLISILLFINMIFVLFGEEVKYNVKNINKILILFIFIVVVTLTFTALYIQVTAEQFGIGHQYIEGVQSRYFIPLLMLSIFVVNRKRIICNLDNIFKFSIILHLPVLLTTLTTFII